MMPRNFYDKWTMTCIGLAAILDVEVHDDRHSVDFINLTSNRLLLPGDEMIQDCGQMAGEWQMRPAK